MIDHDCAWRREVASQARRRVRMASLMIVATVASSVGYLLDRRWGWGAMWTSITAGWIVVRYFDRQTEEAAR